MWIILSHKLDGSGGVDFDITLTIAEDGGSGGVIIGTTFASIEMALLGAFFFWTRLIIGAQSIYMWKEKLGIRIILHSNKK